MLSLRWPFADEVIDGDVSGADRAEGNNFCVVILRDVRDSCRLLVHIQSDGERAKLVQG